MTTTERLKEIRERAEKWARDEIHPASDKDRAWAVIGYEAGASAIRSAIEEERDATRKHLIAESQRYVVGSTSWGKRMDELGAYEAAIMIRSRSEQTVSNKEGE